MLAWHPEHVVSPCQAQQKPSHRPERDDGLAGAEGLLEAECAGRQTWGFAHLATLVRASSLVEMGNSLIRPSRQRCPGPITQETLHLLLVSPNHRRDKSGKRQGQAPLDLLPGEALQAEWVER